MMTKTPGNLTNMSQTLKLSTYENGNVPNKSQSHSTHMLTRSPKIRYHIAKHYRVLTPTIGRLLSTLRCTLCLVRIHGRSPNFPPTESLSVVNGYLNENSTLTVMSNDTK